MEIGKTDVTKQEKNFIHVPISVYFGWITTATIANVTALLVSVNWDGFGIAEEVWAIVILAVAAVIYVLTVITRNDIAYGLVGVWSTLGIVLKQIIEAPVVGYTALVVMIVIGLAITKVAISKMK